MSRYFLYKKALLFDGEHHQEPQLEPSVAKAVLRQSNALLLRNTYNFDNTENRSFWYVIKDSFNGFDELKSRTRNKIRHAFKFFDIRPLTKEEVHTLCYDVYYEASKSYSKTTDRILNEKEFDERLNDCNEYWGCIEKSTGILIAYCENIIRKTSCEFKTLKARPSHLSGGYYPFYGLVYRITEHYLNEKHLKYVSDGSRTITRQSEIQNFLIRKFNFRKAYTDIRVYYKPLLGFFIKVLYHIRIFVPQGKLKSLLRQEKMVHDSIRCNSAP